MTYGLVTVAFERLNPYRRRDLRAAWERGAIDSLAGRVDPDPTLHHTVRTAWGRGHAAMRDERQLSALPVDVREAVESARVQRIAGPRRFRVIGTAVMDGGAVYTTHPTPQLASAHADELENQYRAEVGAD